jgi:CHAT domain
VTNGAVETFHIKVMRGDSAGRHLVTAQWRGNTTPGEVQLDSLRMRTIESLVRLLRTNRLTRIDELILLGEHLFVSLFGAEPANANAFSPHALFRAATSVPPAARGSLTRVSLEIVDVPELASWPWEYLFVPPRSGDPTNGFFLGDQTNFVFTRHFPHDVSERWENIRPPLRILFVVLSPRAGDPPLGGIEYEAVLETLIHLRNAHGPERIDLRVLTDEHNDEGDKLPEDEIGATTRTSYRAFRNTVVNFDPHVVHIIGHGRYRYDEGGGSAGQIAFPDTDSTPLWLTDWDLSNALRDSPSLRLVFLQACESAATQYSPYQIISGLALRLAQRSIPAVIAMHFQVKSALVNEFARAFYDKMKERTDIEIAMHAARRELFLSEVGDESQRGGFGLPVLYLRGSGALLTPLEVPAQTVRSVAARPEADRSAPRDAQYQADPSHLHVAQRQGESTRFGEATRSSDEGLVVVERRAYRLAEYREQR